MLAGALVQWLKMPAWKVGDCGFQPHSGLQVSKIQYVSSPLTRKDSILWPRGNVLVLRPPGLEFQTCVWRAVSSHHPQEVLLAQFSLHVHKGGLKPYAFHLCPDICRTRVCLQVTARTERPWSGTLRSRSPCTRRWWRCPWWTRWARKRS